MATAASQKTWFGHPIGLSTLFFTEMWERFSFYGMRALLTLYMLAPLAAGGLGMSTRQATLIYGTYTMSVYMLSIAGGTIADNLLGSRRAVLIGGIIIAAGHFCMAATGTFFFYTGLLLIVLGTGLLKPSISAMVGQLYTPEDSRRDSGFSIFYMGINLGAFLSPIVTGYLAQHSQFKDQLVKWGMDPANSWHWGFGAAGVGMLLGIIVFVLSGANLRQIGPPPKPTAEAFRKSIVVLFGTLGLWGIVWLSDQNNLGGLDFTWIRYLFLLTPVVLMIWFGRSQQIEVRRLAAILYFFVGALVFWALFEQAGSSLNIFAERFTRTHVGSIEVPASWYQSAGPFFVICFAPIFAWLWNRSGDQQPSSPMKFTIGLVLLAIAFGLMVPAARLAMEGRVSPLWLLSLYLVQTLGELCLSPVGLSTYTKLSPSHLVGAMLGIWFLGAAFGNKFAGVLASAFGEGDASDLDSFFGRQAVGILIVAAVFFALTPTVRKWMGGVR